MDEYSEERLHQSKQHLIITVSIVFIVLEVVCVVLRFTSKFVERLKFGWDDALMVVGLILCIADASCTIAAVIYGGIGLHQKVVRQIDPEMLVTATKFLITTPLLYFATVVPPKLAILHLYLSIFTHKTLRKICFGTGAVIVVNWLVVTIAGLVSCRPLSYYWTFQGSCIDINVWLRWGGFAHIFTDVVMLILPMPVVWNLHASSRLKLGIWVTFLMGSVGMVSSIIRFREFYVTNVQGDVTWAASTLVIWGEIEGGIYLIAACLPTYRPLTKLLWRRVLRKHSQMGESLHTGTGHRASPLRQGLNSTHNESKFPWMEASGSEEDVLRMVTLGSRSGADIKPGQIVVEHHFSVH
ncbi:hypothetical protein CBS147343_6680 [Aspergillus niger]|uniref:Rhodopsin domain-containing protein n=1 Tax=Aspergillus phoenicis ATCC 13157 TaxID=1353007 RepID=A0A370Q0G3_ASPPH|nr:hypothetical protein CBS11350_4413 [Aspergillus niger]RDK47931.1 hypothetical protein M752DRAFT_261256 [Aspergillus phoenicis ATCC 13157]KAI2856517.1 hypothetical protein CBS12448_6918 [Aspergillus niger]KAI2919954.1 hypothetical protein CBS147371_3432 [Aspergillus niger]KAI2928174.1 hypothetical protein CBS147320_4706 [Aspergillus niger]